MSPSQPEKIAKHNVRLREIAIRLGWARLYVLDRGQCGALTSIWRGRSEGLADEAVLATRACLRLPGPDIRSPATAGKADQVVLTGVLDFESAWAGLAESDLARLELWRLTRGTALRDGYAEVPK